MSNGKPMILSPGPQPGSWLLDIDPNRIYTAVKQMLRRNPSIIELSKTKDGNLLIAFDPARRLEAIVTLTEELCVRTLRSDDTDLQQLIDHAHHQICRQAPPLPI